MRRRRRRGFKGRKRRFSKGKSQKRRDRNINAFRNARGGIRV